jgi:hypothetical protein
MWRVIGVAVVLTLVTFLIFAFLSFGGCQKQPDPWQPPTDELSGDAAAMPPGKVKVRLTRQPAARAADLAPLPELEYEWAALASVQPDQLGKLTDEEKAKAAGKSGWAVTRYSLVVKRVGPNDFRMTPEEKRVNPGPGMMFVRHEGEGRWAVFFAGVEKTTGTAGYHYHTPGSPRVIRLFARGAERVRPRDEEDQKAAPPAKKLETFKPWTYSVEAKAGPLADVVTPLLTAEVVRDLPTTVDVLKIGDAVTSLDLRP